MDFRSKKTKIAFAFQTVIAILGLILSVTSAILAVYFLTSDGADIVEIFAEENLPLSEAEALELRDLYAYDFAFVSFLFFVVGLPMLVLAIRAKKHLKNLTEENRFEASRIVMRSFAYCTVCCCASFACVVSPLIRGLEITWLTAIFFLVVCGLSLVSSIFLHRLSKDLRYFKAAEKQSGDNGYEFWDKNNNSSADAIYFSDDKSNDGWGIKRERDGFANAPDLTDESPFEGVPANPDEEVFKGF